MIRGYIPLLNKSLRFFSTRNLFFALSFNFLHQNILFPKSTAYYSKTLSCGLGKTESLKSSHRETISYSSFQLSLLSPHLQLSGVKGHVKQFGWKQHPLPCAKYSPVIGSFSGNLNPVALLYLLLFGNLQPPSRFLKQGVD